MLQSPMYFGNVSSASMGLYRGCDEARGKSKYVDLGALERRDERSRSSESRATNESPKSVISGHELAPWGERDDAATASTLAYIRTPGVEEQVVLERTMTIIDRDRWMECYATATTTAEEDKPASQSNLHSPRSPHGNDACFESNARAGTGCPTEGLQRAKDLALDMSVMMAQTEDSMLDKMHHYRQSSEGASSSTFQRCGSDALLSLPSSKSASFDSQITLGEGHSIGDLDMYAPNGEETTTEVEMKDIMEDMLLNSMERQWTGRDVLMERMEVQALKNSGRDLPTQHYESF